MGTTAAQKKLFFNLHKLKGQMQTIEEGDLNPEVVTAIAVKLSVAEGEVVNMNRHLSSPNHSLNAPLRIDGDGEWQDWLVDDRDDQETLLAEREELGERRRLPKDALCLLNQRERRILQARRLSEEPSALEDLSREYGVSRERIRQIEVRTLEKLQKSMRSAVVEQNLHL